MDIIYSCAVDVKLEGKKSLFLRECEEYLEDQVVDEG